MLEIPSARQLSHALALKGRILALRAAFDESKHPRGQPGNPGQFVEKGKGGGGGGGGKPRRSVEEISAELEKARAVRPSDDAGYRAQAQRVNALLEERTKAVLADRHAPPKKHPLETPLDPPTPDYEEGFADEELYAREIFDMDVGDEYDFRDTPVAKVRWSYRLDSRAKPDIIPSLEKALDEIGAEGGDDHIDSNISSFILPSGRVWNFWGDDNDNRLVHEDEVRRMFHQHGIRLHDAVGKKASGDEALAFLLAHSRTIKVTGTSGAQDVTALHRPSKAQLSTIKEAIADGSLQDNVPLDFPGLSERTLEYLDGGSISRIHKQAKQSSLRAAYQFWRRVLAGAFDDARHPRDDEGRFAEQGNGSSGDSGGARGPRRYRGQCDCGSDAFETGRYGRPACDDCIEEGYA